jgi:hypothetical protein
MITKQMNQEELVEPLLLLPQLLPLLRLTSLSTLPHWMLVRQLF